MTDSSKIDFEAETQRLQSKIVALEELLLVHEGSAHDQAKHLETALANLKQEISGRELIQLELVKLSRLAGMADIATGVLHNIGNVLNSANISIWALTNAIKSSKFEKLTLAMDILASHEDEMAEFIVTDPKGMKTIRYLMKLSTLIVHDQSEALELLTELSDSVGHMKEIVFSQQKYAKARGLKTRFALSEVATEAIRLVQPSFQQYSIRLVEEFDEVPNIRADRHKVLQILVNLIGNATEAMRESGTERVMTVRIARKPDDCIALSVSDTGVGILADDHAKLFQHGFTTKRDGHGFGLHTSATDAAEMNARLEASSEGRNRGAVFSLTLPIGDSETRASATGAVAPEPQTRSDLD